MPKTQNRVVGIKWVSKAGLKKALDSRARRGLERIRADVYSRHLGRIAPRDPPVRDFRLRLSGSRLLTSDQADHFLRQIAPRFLPVEWFDQRGISIVDHDSRCRDSKGNTVLFPYAGTDIEIRFRGDVVTLPVTDEMIRGCSRQVKTIEFGGRPIQVAQEGAVVQFRGQSWRAAFGSVVSELKHLADDTAKSYQWDEQQALWFILVGAVPFVFPVSISRTLGFWDDHDQVKLTIEFEPWVTANSVLRAYREARRSTLQSQGRLLEESRLRLFEFVEEYREKETRPIVDVPNGADAMDDSIIGKPLLEAWNKEHPRWKFRSLGDMKAAFRRTAATLLRPPTQHILQQYRADRQEKGDGTAE